MLPKPSLVLQVKLSPEEYSEAAAAEIKRSYMYLAQSLWPSWTRTSAPRATSCA
ncbi:hypothetical protein [Adlercreutzia equolifaciens]|uniref:hypothetical protein n=1 Tax=Adlercreutzia equolifaciens TaxID=446660 RepID=UPI003AEF2247